MTHFLQFMWLLSEFPYVYVWKLGPVACIVPFLAGFFFSNLIEMVSLSHNITLVCSVRSFSVICVLKI